MKPIYCKFQEICIHKQPFLTYSLCTIPYACEHQIPLKETASKIRRGPDQEGNYYTQAFPDIVTYEEDIIAYGDDI